MIAEVLPYIIRFPELVDELAPINNKRTKELTKFIKETVGETTKFEHIEYFLNLHYPDEVNKSKELYEKLNGLNIGKKDSKRILSKYVKEHLLSGNITKNKDMLIKANEALNKRDFEQYNTLINLLNTQKINTDNNQENNLLLNISTRSESIKPIKTGHKQLDSLLGGGIEKGYLMSITADNGSLKTRYSIDLTLSLMMQNKDLKMNYFEIEMAGIKIENMIYKWFFNEKPQLGENNYEKIKGNKEAYDLFKRIKVIDSNVAGNIHDLYNTMLNNPADIFVVDYFTLLAANEKDLNQATFQNAFMLKELSKETNSIGIIINQANKNAINRRNKRIVESDAEYSKQIGNQSAYHLGLFYPYRYYHHDPEIIEKGLNQHMFYVDILKTRESGGYGTCIYEVHPANLTFIEPTTAKSKQYENWLTYYSKYY